ncbi:hypothetical protein [Winogradskyella alexanderae]|uniref:Uncharacterized protein n=1 Tax=Winogradskyella alexanderae TaxID=2877123 RepID=A0ABS7XUH2_9FLAO|nr:hypothetical protein [Winogradskyella alexanderae]MCA0133685.1 hypothetical protein [Winogradskyella alexanderae]
MKTIKSILFCALALGSIQLNVMGQQMYHVHEDIVKPGMTAEYEAVLSEVGALLESNPIEDTNMMVFQSSSNHYFWISPIASMADLDKPSPVAKLAKKAGEDKVWPLFTRMDKCYDVERNYIITLDAELSYMPNGLTLTPEGEDYREHYKLYVTPSNRAVVKEKLEKIKAMFTKNNSKMHYRVYKSGFGTESEYYLVSVAAKDEMHMAEKGKAHEDLMGEDGKNMMFEMFQTILSIEEMEGYMRPDLAYTSN